MSFLRSCTSTCNQAWDQASNFMQKAYSATDKFCKETACPPGSVTRYSVIYGAKTVTTSAVVGISLYAFYSLGEPIRLTGSYVLEVNPENHARAIKDGSLPEYFVGGCIWAVAGGVLFCLGSLVKEHYTAWRKFDLDQSSANSKV